jgi:hypothetical protein
MKNIKPDGIFPNSFLWSFFWGLFMDYVTFDKKNLKALKYSLIISLIFFD